ncbi:sensor histidine kinase [Acetobacter thailandicus]|uniref:sensor histidine kinase n=1 Tax=Acetobacter thailandicus TaxID=1502842 RepID=UPI001BAA49E3|nr:HAMP domain-containing sensor histidine kinase [Acetobacter thailandicus]MBS0961373.1 HAMP domain-containing histidine kinase [Acetobacter thailandicus]
MVTPRPSDTDAIRNKALLNHAPVALLFRDTAGAVHAANRAARRLFSTDDRLTAEQMNVFSSEKKILRLLSPGNKEARAYSLSVAQAGGTGGLSQLLALTDIETELNEADARALRDLFHIISHEIMNSLTPIISLTETACSLLSQSDATASHEMLAESLDIILRRTKGMENFVQNYRMLARLPPPNLQYSDIKNVFYTSIKLFEARWGKKVRLIISAPSAHVLIRVDSTQIEQAILNLLNNAAEASLETLKSCGATVWFEADITSHSAVIHINDNGKGINEADCATIFQPFVTFKKGGSGIGLTLARQIILAHGGSLTLEPRQDSSLWVTSFKLIIPMI